MYSSAPGYITALIGIFYTQDKVAALLFGKQIIVQHGAYTTEV
jgi:hypothetical protein